MTAEHCATVVVMNDFDFEAGQILELGDWLEYWSWIRANKLAWYMHEYGEGEKRKHTTKARVATKKLITTSLCKLSTYLSALIEFAGRAQHAATYLMELLESWTVDILGLFSLRFLVSKIDQTSYQKLRSDRWARNMRLVASSLLNIAYAGHRVDLDTHLWCWNSLRRYTLHHRVVKLF